MAQAETMNTQPGQVQTDQGGMSPPQMIQFGSLLDTVNQVAKTQQQQRALRNSQQVTLGMSPTLQPTSPMEAVVNLLSTVLGKNGDKSANAAGGPPSTGKSSADAGSGGKKADKFGEGNAPVDGIVRTIAAIAKLFA